MPEMTRSHADEYVSPRYLILGLCFIWGIAVGFSLNFLRSPDPEANIPSVVANDPTPPPIKVQVNDQQRRTEGAPVIAEVEPAAPTQTDSTSFELLAIPPPPPLVSPEVGLNGQTAMVRKYSPAPPTIARPQGFSAQPPPMIPDLDP